MSISLLLTYPLNDSRNKIVPIATSDSFRNQWLPLVRNLGLKWIPLFETGVPVQADEIEDILSELREMRQAAASLESSILPRIDMLISELVRVCEDTSVTIFVG